MEFSPEAAIDLCLIAKTRKPSHGLWKNYKKRDQDSQRMDNSEEVEEKEETFLPDD